MAASAQVRNMVCVRENAFAIVLLTGEVLTYGFPDALKAEVEGWSQIRQIDMCIRPDLNTAYVVGLKRDGTVVFTGNDDGEILDVSGLKDIVQIACGYRDIYAIDRSGHAFSVSPKSGSHLDLKEWKDVIRIAGGTLCVCGLTRDGEVLIECVRRFYSYAKTRAAKAHQKIADILIDDCRFLHVLTEDGVVPGVNGPDDCVNSFV